VIINDEDVSLPHSHRPCTIWLTPS
jgi:hypothetical protein